MRSAGRQRHHQVCGWVGPEGMEEGRVNWGEMGWHGWGARGRPYQADARDNALALCMSKGLAHCYLAEEGTLSLWLRLCSAC